VEAVNHREVRSCLIDGEVVCCDEKGGAAFQLLRHRRNEPRAFLYVFEPGGNRIELFGNSGILQFEPDYETVTWDLADFDTGIAIGGANLPAETYFVYGTPGADGQDKLLTGWTDRHLV